MFRRLTLLVLATTIFSGFSRVASAAANQGKQRDSEPRSLSEAEARSLALHTPSPQYPYEARVRHLTGAGLVGLEIDQRTGYVASARMLKSTGHQILDDSSLKAFRQWRFKAGTITAARIPVRFVMGGGPGWWSRDAYGFEPKHPREARDRGLTGSGVVLVRVNPGTGNIISARMLNSTGHKVLDDAALNAVRHWRFKAGTASSLRIPITFTKTGITY
jgi:TonB family protein